MPDKAVKEAVIKLCAKARIDVYPFRNGERHGPRTRGNIHRMGMHSTEGVDIFNYAGLGLVRTVEEQIEFDKKWRESLIARMS